MWCAFAVLWQLPVTHSSKGRSCCALTFVRHYAYRHSVLLSRWCARCDWSKVQKWLHTGTSHHEAVTCSTSAWQLWLRWYSAYWQQNAPPEGASLFEDMCCTSRGISSLVSRQQKLQHYKRHRILHLLFWPDLVAQIWSSGSAGAANECQTVGTSVGMTARTWHGSKECTQTNV